MATFHVLPPRSVVGEQVARLLRPFLPGVHLDHNAGVRILESLTEELGRNVFLVFRDDLPTGEVTANALRDGFGASESDRIVQVQTSPEQVWPREMPVVRPNMLTSV